MVFSDGRIRFYNMTFYREAVVVEVCEDPDDVIFRRGHMGVKRLHGDAQEPTCEATGGSRHMTCL
jgi:hypothetical protein